MRKWLILLFCGCAAPLPTPDQPGARDAYRAAMVRDAKTPRAQEARERLEQAEWEAARSAHTIFAYRRFLQEFGDSHHAPEARQLLEGLRWAGAERDGSEAALAGYLDDQPRGAHAAQAWSLLSALRLEKVLRNASPPALRGWLAENSGAPGWERAQAALDAADWRAATEPAAWRRYLDEHLDGAHRAEAQARLSQAAVQEALVLEDESRLRQLDAAAADRLAYERAAALLDEGRLGHLAKRRGPHAADAARDLASLRRDSRRAGELEAAARKLFLPRATLDELPEASPDRARRLRQWAFSLDGNRLHRLLAEIASPRARVALAALDGAETLLRGLPPVESRLRAERELAMLRPVAEDAPRLAAVALLEGSLGRARESLATARRAAGRDPRSAPAVWLAVRLESEPGLLQGALQVLRAQARALAAAYADAARRGEPAALAELCAASRASVRAAAAIAEAKAEVLAISRQIEEGERAAHLSRACDERPAETASERREAARFLAASGTPLARAALARAAARDPDPDVRAAAQGALAAALR